MTERKTYIELLKDPRWQRKRLEILQSAGFSCEMCGETEKTLHVHHRHYRKGAMPWEYSNDELESLCEDCHSAQHQLKKAIDQAVSEMPISMLDHLLGYAEGLLLLHDCDAESVTIRNFEHAQGLAAACGKHPGLSMPVYAFIDAAPDHILNRPQALACYLAAAKAQA